MGVALFFFFGAVIIGTGLIYLGVIAMHPEAQEERKSTADIQIQLESRPGVFVFHLENRGQHPATLCFAPGLTYSLMVKKSKDTFEHWRSPETPAATPLTAESFVELPALGKQIINLPFKKENGSLVFSNGYYFRDFSDGESPLAFRYDPKITALQRGRKLGFKHLFKGHLEIKDFSCKLASL